MWFWSVTCLQYYTLIAHCQYLLTGGKFLPFIRISTLRTPHTTCIFVSHRVSLVKPSPLQFRVLQSLKHVLQFMQLSYLLLGHVSLIHKLPDWIERWRKTPRHWTQALEYKTSQKFAWNTRALATVVTSCVGTDCSVEVDQYAWVCWGNYWTSVRLWREDFGWLLADCWKCCKGNKGEKKMTKKIFLEENLGGKISREGVSR